MLRIKYFNAKGQLEDSETIQAGTYDYINAYREAARNAGEPIRVIGPSMQAMCWVTVIQTRDGHVEITERAS